MKIDHIGIAVRDLSESKVFYEALGLTCGGEEVVDEQKVRVAFFAAGDSRIELLEPTDPLGPIGKFLEKKGPGLHHLCVQVEDIRTALNDLKEGGYTLIDQEPRVGAGGCLVAFVHPKSTGGVLLELSQDIREPESRRIGEPEQEEHGR